MELSLSIRADTVGPLGGFKMSGLGHACSIEGIEAFLETKRVSKRYLITRLQETDEPVAV